MKSQVSGPKSQVVVVLTLIVLVLGAARAFAQQSPPPTKGSQTAASQEGYVPVDQLKNAPQQETIPAARLVGIAYGFVWVMLVLYVWSIWNRLGKVERELQSVSRRIPGGGRPA
jgi:hypothetical protein